MQTIENINYLRPSGMRLCVCVCVCVLLVWGRLHFGLARNFFLSCIQHIFVSCIFDIRRFAFEGLSALDCTNQQTGFARIWPNSHYCNICSFCIVVQDNGELSSVNEQNRNISASNFTQQLCETNCCPHISNFFNLFLFGR